MTRKERIRAIKADFGRDWGWTVEADGVVHAVLTEPELADMFWYTYRVEAVGPAPDTVFTQAFWRRPDLVYRNRRTGDAVPAFSGGGWPNRDAPFVTCRGLYLCGTMNWYEAAHFLLEKARRWWRARWAGRSRREVEDLDRPRD